MGIADLPKILRATDNKGGNFEFAIDDYSKIKTGTMWVKMQELINHINILEEKLLNVEEREGIKAANEAKKGEIYDW